MNEHAAAQSLLLCAKSTPSLTDGARNASFRRRPVTATAARKPARGFCRPFVYFACFAGPLLGSFSATSATTEADFKSAYYALSLSPTNSAFARLSVDSLGQGRLSQNPVFIEGQPAQPWQIQKLGAKQLACRPVGADPKSPAAWEFEFAENSFLIRSRFIEGRGAVPLVLTFDQHSNHATLLGLMQPHELRVLLPALLHLPDLGSVRITADAPGWKLDYDARRNVPRPFVRISFPPATTSTPRVEYRCEVTAIYPPLKGIEKDPLFDGFRRSYLNMLQVNPRVQMLANNSSSDPCAFTVYEYADIARQAPPLAKGLTCLDLIRMTLDRYLDGALGYGLVGYKATPEYPDTAAWGGTNTALDSYPSLIIAACDYAMGAKDVEWARRRYDRLTEWARAMMDADRDHNGLIEYPTSGNYGDRPKNESRPSNWWDTINFGHEDAYANALAFRAYRMLARVAYHLGKGADANFFLEKARKLRATYVPTFRNPKTGVLAGWKSADGQLHDYWFTFINGMAISYELVDDKDAKDIMDRLLRKMDEVGYQSYQLGLPGNLIPVAKGDYIIGEHRWGVPEKEDGSDGFQIYENGGATTCHAYYTIKALYQLGRVQEARKLFYPMLKGFAAGDYQGFGPDGQSKDWRAWDGACHGYEGFLVDGFLPLLAVFDEVSSRKPK